MLCFEHDFSPSLQEEDMLSDVFGCKSFILKKGKNLDKFGATSVDGIFLGYTSHSIAFRVLNLETNQIIETCEVTFDETQLRSSLVFDCAGDDELGEEIF
jgi:hypothetical protein